MFALLEVWRWFYIIVEKSLYKKCVSLGAFAPKKIEADDMAKLIHNLMDL